MSPWWKTVESVCRAKGRLEKRRIDLNGNGKYGVFLVNSVWIWSSTVGKAEWICARKTCCRLPRWCCVPRTLACRIGILSGRSDKRVKTISAAWSAAQSSAWSSRPQTVQKTSVTKKCHIAGLAHHPSHTIIIINKESASKANTRTSTNHKYYETIYNLHLFIYIENTNLILSNCVIITNTSVPTIDV